MKSPITDVNEDSPVRYYLVGPTASGKGTVGRKLADRMEVELISLDSMKLYRHMDIGTAKPPPEERKDPPFHLLDEVDPHESFSVADYIRRAEEVEEAIRRRGRTPLFVGGTAMYLKRLIEGLFEGPEADWEFREKRKKEAEKHGRKTLHDRLKQVDPDRAEEIHPNDLRRTIRALEVYEKMGRPMSELLRESQEEAEHFDHRAVCLKWPREHLFKRINARIEEMMEQGWKSEVEQLLSLDPPPGSEAMQAAGYEELQKYIEGNQSLEETIENIRAEHRQLARHQMTWFRNLEEHLTWIELKPDMSLREITKRVQTAFVEGQ